MEEKENPTISVNDDSVEGSVLVQWICKSAFVCQV